MTSKEKINKLELFEAILTDKINNKNYKKFKLSKTQFYKIYSRILFFRSIVEPVKFCVLNLSEREFHAVKDSKLKTELPSRKQFKSFHMRGKNSSKQEDETDKGYGKKTSSKMYSESD